MLLFTTLRMLQNTLIVTTVYFTFTERQG